MPLAVIRCYQYRAHRASLAGGKSLARATGTVMERRNVVTPSHGTTQCRDLLTYLEGAKTTGNPQGKLNINQRRDVLGIQSERE